jgi:hypothetical protein
MGAGSGGPSESYSKLRDMSHDQTGAMDMMHSIGHLCRDGLAFVALKVVCAHLVQVPLSRGTFICANDRIVALGQATWKDVHR